MPDFYLIMGPSGSGKSTYGKLFMPTGLSIFNGDELLQNLQNQFPNETAENYREKAAAIYQKERDKSIACHHDFALETPFADHTGIDNIYVFKRAGYSIKGIFFGIDSLSCSLVRIEDRVRKGGHRVTPGNAEFNYINSFRNIISSIWKELFDGIIFVDSNNDFIKIIAEYTKITGILSIFEAPRWFNGICRQLSGWVKEQ